MRSGKTFSVSDIPIIIKKIAKDEEFKSMDFLDTSSYKGKSFEQIRKDIDKFLREYKDVLNIITAYEYEGDRPARAFTPYEERLLCYFILVKSKTNDTISKIKREKPIEFVELRLFLKNLVTFLNANAFKENGSAFNEELELLKRNNDGVAESEIIMLLLENTVNAYNLEHTFHILMLRNYRALIKEKLDEAVNNFLEEIIPQDVANSIQPMSYSEDALVCKKFDEEHADVDGDKFDEEFDDFYEETPYFYTMPSGIFKGDDYELAIDLCSIVLNELPISLVEKRLDSLKAELIDYCKQLFKGEVLIDTDFTFHNKDIIDNEIIKFILKED